MWLELERRLIAGTGFTRAGPQERSLSTLGLVAVMWLRPFYVLLCSCQGSYRASYVLCLCLRSFCCVEQAGGSLREYFDHFIIKRVTPAHVGVEERSISWTLCSQETQS